MNKKEFYIETPESGALLVEVEERHGWIILMLGEDRYDLTPDAAFDIVDALTMVSNSMSSHLGDEG